MSNYIRKTITISFLALALLFVFLLPLSTAKAAESGFISSSLRVSPVILKIQLQPGAKRLYPVTIENRTDAPMPIRATIEGFDPTDELTGFTPNPTADVSPLARWISIDEPDAIIPARQSHEFLVKISIPSTVPIGGYYAMIYFTPLYQNGSVGSKIGVVTLANIGIQDSLQNKAVISEFRFEKPIYEHGPITSSVRITNSSLHYFSTKPTLSISPYWGKPDTVELDEKTILPGKSRAWKSVFTIQNSKWGIYKATIKTRIENGETITKTIPLVIFPYRIFITALLFISIALWIISKRRNIHKALKLLVSSNASANEHIPSLPQVEDLNAAQKTQEGQGDASVEDLSRATPQQIIDTLRSQNGSVSKTASLLGIHRSTIYRWRERAVSSPERTALTRKSTRPHRTRTTSLPDDTIQHIRMLYTKKNLTAKQIKEHLRLSVSDRTILRMVHKYKEAA